MGMRQQDTNSSNSLIYAWFMCLLAASFYSYDFLLRVTPSIMLHPLMQTYGVNATSIGFLSAFYYYIYTPLQLPSGLVVDRYSTQKVLSFSALCCVIGAFVFASTSNIYIGYFARGLMGFGSAFAFVGALKLAATTLPPHHFALFSGFATAFGTLGAITTDTVISRLQEVLGWRQTLYLCALIGALIAIMLFFLIKDTPKQLSKPHAHHSWKPILRYAKTMFRQKTFWFNGIIGAFLFFPITVFASLWGVNFITLRFEVSNALASQMTSLVFLGLTLGAPLAGWFSGRAMQQRQILFIGCSASFLLTLALTYTHFTSLSVACVLLFFMGFSCAPQVLVFAIAKEMSPYYAVGIATAATNFFITLGASIFQPLTGYILNWTWSGDYTHIGTPFYSLWNYKIAFIPLCLALGSSIMLCCFLPQNPKSNEETKT